MSTKIHIPTPLRPFTGKRDVVELEGATVGELLAKLTSEHEALKKHLYNEDGRLRSFVNIYLNDEDIRYLEKEQTPVKPGDSLSIIPSVAGGSRCRDGAAAAEADAQRRGDQALQPSPDPAGSRHGRAEEAEGGERAVHRRRRPRVAGRDVSRGGRHRHARHRRLRRRRLQQPAAPDPSRHAGRRPPEAAVGEGSPARRSIQASRSRPTRRR